MSEALLAYLLAFSPVVSVAVILWMRRRTRRRKSEWIKGRKP
jgi:hypothetical protein